MIFDPSNEYFILTLYITYLIVMSIFTFILYGLDKRRAIKGQYRVPEKALLLLSFLGGAFGGFPAMLIFRHKTRGEHWYFTFINVVAILLHVAAILLIDIYLIK